MTELANGERVIARVSPEGVEMPECGAEGSCMFDGFIVGAILTSNPELELAVS
jgi:hypothetical protein